MNLPKAVERWIRASVPESIRVLHRRRRVDRYRERDYRLSLNEFDGFRVAFRSGTADEAVLKDSFSDDIFLPAVPEYVPSPTDVILDVGAHIGTFSLLAARNSPAGKVYAVEASLETSNYLKVNFALNSLANAEAFHLALTDKVGVVRLHHDAGNWGHSVTAQLSTFSEEVPSSDLASFLSSNKIDHVDFVKFNCEGAEFPILMTSDIATLAKFSTMLILYHCDLAEGYSPEGYSLEGLISHLTAAGFRSTLRNQSEHRGWLIATKLDAAR